jgi:TRAP-type C4-dicarboxylate transport system permease small subunit|tara:strand:+ start:234 stop:791 length:558 start_codon:yes stop_codon:yes gene_type:complete
MGMKTQYVAAMDNLFLACIWFAGFAIVCMSLVIPWGVFTRYVLGSGSQWPEPIAILLMMVFTFIGAAAGYRANSHIAVTMLTDKLPASLHQITAIFVDVMMATACLFVVWYGASLCLGTMGQSISELPWLPVGVTYLSLPLGSLFTLLFVVERRWVGPQDHRHLMRYEEDIDAFNYRTSEIKETP